MVVVRLDPSCNGPNWSILLLGILFDKDEIMIRKNCFPSIPKKSPWREDRSFVVQTPE